MGDRKSIPKSIRFEVFKRDNFTCQYCGLKAPDVVLEVDHIEPVSKNGTNEIINLITSCKSCNSGKRDKRLNDDTVIDKQRKTLEELQEKREQMRLMVEWKKELLNVNQEEIDGISDYFEELTGYFITENYKANKLKQLIRKFGFSEVMESIDISYDSYFKTGGKDEVEKMLNKLGGILYNRKLEKDDPEQYEQRKTRAYARSVLGYINEWKCKDIIYRLINDTEMEHANIKELILNSNSWTQFYNASLEILEG